MLSDSYASSAGAASAGIGASSLAVYNTWCDLDFHANVGATATAWGHVQLTDDYTVNANKAATSTAASGWVGYKLYNLLSTHENSMASKTNRAHVKIVDDCSTANTPANSQGLAASAYAVYTVQQNLASISSCVSNKILIVDVSTYISSSELYDVINRDGDADLIAFVPGSVPVPIKVTFTSASFSDVTIPSYYTKIFTDVGVVKDGSTMITISTDYRPLGKVAWFVYDY